MRIVNPPGVQRVLPGTGILVNNSNPQYPVIEAAPGYLDTVVFPFPVPSATWTINHGLNCYPSVTIVDSTGREVIGAVEYIDADNLTVTFSAAFSGTAYLN